MKFASLDANRRLTEALGRMPEFEEAIRLSNKIGEAIAEIQRQDELHKLCGHCPLCGKFRPKNLTFVMGMNNLSYIACLSCFLHGASISVFNFPNDTLENSKARAVFLWNAMAKAWPAMTTEDQRLLGLINRKDAQTS